MISQKDFATFIFHMAKAIPTFAPDFKDAETLAIWFKAFADFDMEDLRKVYAYARDNEQQFPSIARLKVLLNSGRDTGKFDELVKLIGAHGSYRPPVVDDLMARAVNRMGGWKRVCEWSNDELPFRRREFDEVYEQFKNQKQMGKLDQSHVSYLQGEHETAEAFLVSSPARLGLAPPVKESVVAKPCVNLWQKLHEKYGEELDESLADRLKAKGFFKLKTTPGYFYRYRSTVDPTEKGAVPYKFVDVDDHMSAIRKKASGQSNQDPNTFDSSRYSYERFDDSV